MQPETPKQSGVILPERLRQGDTIAVVAPAGSYDSNLLQKGVAIWEERGFHVHVPDGLDQQEEYLAGPDWWRAGVIHDALTDPDIKALIVARGGYGSFRTFERLRFELFPRHPKIFLGFSDITALHLELWRRHNLATFSGPMIAGTQLSKMSDVDLDVYFDTLTSPEPPPPVSGSEVRVVLRGEAEGPLLGGNLTLLCHAAAAGCLPDLTGAIVFLEDIFEAPYRLDRMLTVLRLGGHLDKIAGIAGGQFGPQVDEILLDTIFLDRLGDLGVPIIMGLDIGHGEKNRLVPVGPRGRLETSPPSLRFLSAGVC